MSEEYGPNFVSLTDEDGHEFELEHVDTIEYKGQVYMAFFPAESEDGGHDGECDCGCHDHAEDKEEEEEGLIILKVVHVDGEDQLVTLDSEDELNEVYDQFMEELFNEDGTEQ